MTIQRLTILVATSLAVMSGCRGSLEGNAASGADDGGLHHAVDVHTQQPDGGLAIPVAAPDTGVVTRRDMPPSGAEDMSEPPFDAGACGGASFGAEAFSVATVPGTAAQDLHAAATAGGGAVLSWRGADGVHVTHVDGSGAVVSDTTVDGTSIYGLAAYEDGRAVMVSRGSDVLALVILDSSNTVISDQTIIGDVPHDVTENEWFGPLLRAGTMTWTGSQWATYFTVQRLWSDGIAHYGDQLRLYEPDGSSSSMVWGWGCSHSMEVKISHNGERLGPVCSSDCYPSKGVHFNHRGGELWPDEGGSNCAGQWGTSLGASVPIPGGFWVAFTATDNRQSHDVALVRIDGTTPQEPIWLTEDSIDDRPLRATSFEDDLVVAWNAGSENQFVLVGGADAGLLAGPTQIEAANLNGSSDFFNYANGDIGWAQAEGGAVGLARLRTCR